MAALVLICTPDSHHLQLQHVGSCPSFATRPFHINALEPIRWTFLLLLLLNVWQTFPPVGHIIKTYSDFTSTRGLQKCHGPKTHLRSLPLDLVVRTGRVQTRQTDGALLSWEGWIREQLPGLQTLLQEAQEVLILRLDRVLDGAQRRRNFVCGHDEEEKTLGWREMWRWRAYMQLKVDTLRILRGAVRAPPRPAVLRRPAKVCGAPGRSTSLG